ncbi:MAG: potassium channel family protein [Dehalobacter sp.]|nr:potassium channel family protein [Dehalobacter sp.]
MFKERYDRIFYLLLFASCILLSLVMHYDIFIQDPLTVLLDVVKFTLLWGLLILVIFILLSNITFDLSYSTLYGVIHYKVIYILVSTFLYQIVLLYMLSGYRLEYDYGLIYFSIIIIDNIVLLLFIAVGIYRTVTRPLRRLSPIRRLLGTIILLFFWEIIIILNMSVFLMLINIYDPNSLKYEGEISIVSLVYFVVTTFASVGYNDITPATKIAQIYSAIVSLLGYTYSIGFVSILIATLLGNHKIFSSSTKHRFKLHKPDKEAIHKYFIKNL